MTTQTSCNNEKLCSADLYGDCVRSYKLAAFTFLGRRYEVNSWATLFKKATEILITDNNSRSVLNNPRLKDYFEEHEYIRLDRRSFSPKQSTRIANTNVRITTDYCDDNLKDATIQLLEHYWYKLTNLCFEYRSDER